MRCEHCGMTQNFAMETGTTKCPAPHKDQLHCFTFEEEPAKPFRLPDAKAEPTSIPMVLSLDKETILFLVNSRLRHEGKPTLPAETDVSVVIPHGGSWFKGDEVDLSEETTLDFRWESSTNGLA